LERLPGGILTHWKAPHFHGAHPLLTLDAPSLNLMKPRIHNRLRI
jgi:hypothetical protein